MKTRKWRPSLALVLGGALAGTLVLSLVGLIVFRYLGPEIGHKNAAAVLGLIIALCTLALGGMLVRLLLRPIRALDQYSASIRMTPTDPAPSPDQFGTRELHATAQSVMDMAATLRNREASIRSFTDHASHEIKTPVAVIRAASELLEDGGGLNQGDLRLLSQITAATRQIEDQLLALRNIARARETRYIGHTMLAEISGWVTQEFPALCTDLKGETLNLPMAPEGIKIVLGHLLDNSRTAGASKIQLSVRSDEDHMQLWFADNGPGISKGNQAHIFEPFFTTNRTEGGTGMGLSIVRNILSVHGGKIALDTKAKGALFCISFPNPQAINPVPDKTRPGQHPVA